MKKRTLEEKDFEKELENLDFDLQGKIEIFINLKPTPSTRKDIEFYLEAKDIAKIRKQLSTDLSDKTIYTYLGIGRRTFSLLRDDGVKTLNSTKEQEVPKIKEIKEETKEKTNTSNNVNAYLALKKIEETNKNNETAILEKLEKIKQQNEKIISFYELSKKKEEENKFNNRKETETDEEDVDIEYPQDTEVMQNSERVLRSFKVNTWVLGEFLRIARKKGMKIETATNKAFQMFSEKYD